MKTGVHPDYHKVLYVDTSNGKEWVAYSTMHSAEKREVDGEELSVIKLEITAHSHPFWTGQQRTVDTEGRIDRFRRRFAKKKPAESSSTEQ